VLADGGGACGTFVALDGKTYGPPEIVDGIETYTPVSQDLATAGDVTTLTTVVALGATGVKLRQTDAYQAGKAWYRTDVDVVNDADGAKSATVYRAAGSHAGSFSPVGVDVAGDAWNGNAASTTPRLLPADEAARAGVRFDPGATAPWDKEVWNDPEAVTTGRPGSRAELARYARWWAKVCLICPDR